MNRNGFTLIEILVVIVVLAVLASLVAPNVFQHVSASKETAVKTQIEMLSAALDAYRLDNGVYPSTTQGLDALRLMPQGAPIPRNWRGPYLRKLVPNDPWSHPYIYTSPGVRNPQSFDLQSYGADGLQGGTGDDQDITNW